MATFYIDADNGFNTNDGLNATATTHSITSSSIANPTNILATGHGLQSTDNTTIAGHTGSTPDINGDHVVTRIDDNNFTIDVNVTTGGTGGTSTDDDGSFKTLNKFTETGRNAGDIAILRRGMTGRYDDGGDLEFTSDGSIVNGPIQIEADFGDEWSDFVNSSQTYTLTYGLKALLASAAITVLVDNQWMFNTTNSDDPREFSYEVANVQTSDSGTDDGADSTKLIDTGKFTNTVIGTEVKNSTDVTTGYVSELVSSNEVEVTVDGRPTASGGTAVVFDNGDNWTIADQAVLFLPFKGTTGSTKTMKVMPTAPIWNTAAGNFQWVIDADNFWKFQGIHLRGTDTNGQVELDSCGGHIFKDCIFEGNGSSDEGINTTDDTGYFLYHKSRSFNNQYGIRSSPGSGAPTAFITDSLFDGNGISLSTGIPVTGWDNITVQETEFRNHASGDLDAVDSLAQRSFTFKGRNLIFASATEIDNPQANDFGVFLIEDYHGTLGDNRQNNGYNVSESSPVIRSETTTVRSGGGTQSIKITPSTAINTNWELGKILVFEYPIYATTSAKTYTVYFRPTSAADWSGNPTNAELWIELEAWGHATFNHRKITKSTGTIDMESTAWQTLTVSVTPSQTGVAYLRCYYAKAKGADAETFFADTFIEIT